MGDGRSEEELIAMGRKPADYNEDAFQGLHARHILIILDEACGIPPSLWIAVETLMTNENARVLAIGNPDDPGADFAKKCKPGSGYNVITISAFDSPNFTGEPIPDDVAEQLVGPMWVEDRRRDWGEGSPLWVSKVTGEFPDVSDEYLITPGMIELGKMVDLPGLEGGQYGSDIARFGTDKSVVYRNRNGQIRLERTWAMADTMESTGRMKVILDKHHPTAIVPMIIDVIGLGAGPFDRLREQGYDVVGFNGAERAFRPDKFKNRRAEVYWTFRELLSEGLIDLDPDDEVLHSQLQSIKWTVDSGGRIVIESKEDMRDRGIPSPDHADACVYSTVRRGPALLAAPQGSLATDLIDKVM
jgi:hypothetical protein